MMAPSEDTVAQIVLYCVAGYNDGSTKEPINMSLLGCIEAATPSMITTSVLTTPVMEESRAKQYMLPSEDRVISIEIEFLVEDVCTESIFGGVDFSTNSALNTLAKDFLDRLAHTD